MIIIWTYAAISQDGWQQNTAAWNYSSLQAGAPPVTFFDSTPYIMLLSGEA